jgi:hypothetical protein
LRTVRGGAQILHRPCCSFAERDGGVKRPVGIAEHFAREENEVGRVVSDEAVGLLRLGDHADGGCGNGSFIANARCEGSLKGGADGDFCIGREPAGRDVDEVDAVGAEMTGESDGVVDGPAVINPIGSGDAHEEGQVRGPCEADGIDDLEQKANAVVVASTVGVGALVGERREKLVQEVAVGGVDLDEVEAGCMSAVSGLREGVDDSIDAGLIEGLGNGVIRCKGDGAGTEGLPAAFAGTEKTLAGEGRGHGSFASGMGELNARADALSVDELRDARKAGDVVVGVNAEIGGGDAAFSEDRGGFEHDEGGSALGAGAEVDEVPIVGESILGGVLAHGGDADAVGEGDRTELKRRKKRMAHDGLCLEKELDFKEMMKEWEKGCKGMAEEGIESTPC